MCKDRCPGCCSSFSQRVKHYFQENGSELKMLLWFAGPLAITNFMDFVPIIITAMFVGRIGKLQLDAIMLAVAYTSVFGVAVGLGLNAACDTLLSQSYGGKNLKYIGVVVQRAILILSLACFPCWAFYINTENILLLCGQDKDLARETELCVLVLIPALPAFFFLQLELRYLQNQEIMWPQILISILASVVTALVNYLMLFVLKIGVMGGALAITIAAIFEFILLLIYIQVKKLHVASWPGWSTECLKDWWPFLALGIPGMLIMSIEFWAYEVAMILTGLITLVELGGQSILFQLITLVQKIPFSVGMAASIRVGIFLGAGETGQAKKSAKLSMVIVALFSLLIFILLLALKKPLGELFTTDKAIVLLVSKTMPLCAIFYVAYSPAGVFNGLLRGIGKPEIGALAFIIGYCLIVFPVAVPLMFPAKLGITGFWTGMITGFTVIDLFFCIYFWKVNWNLMTEKAQELVGLRKDLDSFQHSVDPALFEHSIDTPDDRELTNYAALHTSSSESELQQMDTPEVSKEDRQALKWLIIRRSLEALAVISTLLIGLIIKFTVKRH
ncbi:PREDICTED: multidrug and toxin extrusion protein 1-like [Nanorana parkeri]|uniref:multidrug and toxin extrusion protein 1-like n=1 Tax=Nanorana parkeri TaxID=125878 RepID=UPI0008542C4C|nr:PREDICTED: multidrug and toxin extrusion protein 1-like [Nanorana parkeri]